VFSFFAVAFAALTENAKPLFEQFEKDYAKVYATEAEREYRFTVFAENMARADVRNKMERLGASHGVTQFADITPEEFKRFLGFTPEIHQTAPTGQAMRPNAITCPADSCNWANLGAVTPVKNQGQCGSCWAFSATEATETSTFFYNGTLPVLAPQQIVDCDTTDHGCNGGDTPTAYQYIMSAGGLESENAYPYTAHDGVCTFSSNKVAAAISNYYWGITPCNTIPTMACTNQNETGLWSVVGNSPQSICVDAEPWQLYTGGIMDTPACLYAYTDLDHCVHLTGYGSQAGTQYWLVKNSWGVTWGEQGYIRLVYGKNMCGVADEVTYAIGKKVGS